MRELHNRLKAGIPIQLFGMIDVSLDVRRLAAEVFDPEEYSEIQKLISMFYGPKKQKRLAVLRIQLIVPTRPKRPLYYVNYRIKFLPRSSRFAVEQMGSYLDLLVKEIRFEIEGRYYRSPLGANVQSLIKNAEADLKSLLNKIDMFNNIAYVPAKHKYGPPNETRHYFNSSEAIAIILAAVKLGEELKERSKFVRNLCQDLVLPAQKPLIGNHPRTNGHGAPFNFKERLVNSDLLR